MTTGCVSGAARNMEVVIERPAEQALRDSEARFRSLLSSIDAAGSNISGV